MTKKIFQSIMLVAGAVLIASIVIIMGCLYDYFSAIEERQLEETLTLASHGVEKNGLDYLDGLDSSRYRLTWVSDTGEVFYDTQADPANMDNHADREEIREARESREGTSSRYSTTLLERTLYYAQRLEDGTVLRISVSHATAWVLALGMLQPIIIVLVVALILSGILASRVSKRVMEPLNRLDLEKPLENDVYEELSPLLTRINQQRRQIDRQMQELQRKNDEFTQVTRSMAEGLVLLNQKGVILNINPAARKLFRADSSCVDREFLTIERGRDVNRALATALLDGHGEISIEQDGKEYQIVVNRIESNGQVVGAVLLSFDRSEQAFAERNRREFTANVSHELKTPLHSIMGSAELIKSGLVKPEDMPRFVGHIRTEARRLVTLIEDIIRLSQLDEAQELPAETVDLLAVANEAVETLKDAAAMKNITVAVTGEAVVMQSVHRLLYEIAYNLCDNAIQYNVDGGRVELSVRQGEQGPMLTVTDTGIGIPLEHQERIFERFYRVDKSHSKESGGTGLGLSIVKHAVQYLHGKMELTSTLGTGTTIRIVF